MNSRNRRKQIDKEDNLLVSNPNTLDPKTVDAIGFGLGELGLDIAAADAEFQAIESVNINEIYPNYIQPRYAIPHKITNMYKVHPDHVIDIFKRWIKEVELASRKNFPLENYLLGDNTPRGDDTEEMTNDSLLPTHPTLPKIEQSLMKIVDLAASIRRDGLSNPISLVQRDGFYEIETGERRWLAYHMLYWQFGENDLLSENQKRNWSRIPSRIVREVDVWRQASENNARDNLNAISKARQLAVLLMDLHGWDKFAPYPEFENEQDFYAQVADGEQWRIPRGNGEKLLNAMGLSNPSQLRQYRRLLRLSPDEWRKGDDENMTEGELRKLLNKSYTVTPVTVSPKKSKVNPIKKLATDANQWRTSLRKQIKTQNPDTRRELKSLIQEEIEQLQQLIDELSDLE